MLDPNSIRKYEGFGMANQADGYGVQPTSIEEIRSALKTAAREGRNIVLRGAGRSYGDTALLAEGVCLDLTRMNRFLSWDSQTGIVECEPGVTLEQIWRTALPNGWWPPVVSGTMFPTLGGALAMNIHGKNNFRLGTLGDHVLEIDVLLANGEILTIPASDERLNQFVSSAGLLGIIVRIKLQLKKVETGLLKVYAESIPGWERQFEAFEKRLSLADYMVSWIDAFGKNQNAGRGLFHAAWHDPEGDRDSLLEMRQDLPEKILGILPKAQVWRVLKHFNNRTGMRCVNAVKFHSARWIGNEKMHAESLVEFSFLLDYAPNWKWAYRPGGFIQYQSFVPAAAAPSVFARQIELSQGAQLEPYLAVMKRHRPDNFLLSHGVEGYSLALDYKVTEQSWPDLQSLCHRMNDVVLEANGKFYFAKDSTLRPSDAIQYLDANLEKLRALKDFYDPTRLFDSELARRLDLFPGSLMA